MNAIGPEVVILSLFAVGDDRRPRRLEPLDRVPGSVRIEGFERRVGVTCGERFEQPRGPGNAADRLGRYRDHETTLLRFEACNFGACQPRRPGREGARVGRPTAT